MSQTYYDDVYSGSMAGATTLQRIENNFAAVKSLWSGSTAPSDPVAGMPWIDTTKHLFKVRNEANTAWLEIWDLTKADFDSMFAAALGVLDGDRGDITVSGNGMTWTISATAITVSQMAEYAAGNYPICVSIGETQTQNTAYTKAKEIYLSRGGAVRVKFKAYTDYAGGYARVYINGVASGTELELPTSGYQSTAVSEDFNVSAKSRVQLYVKGASGAIVYSKEFGIYTAALEQSCVTVE